MLFMQVKMLASICTCETAPGAGHPVLGCSVSRRCGHAGVSPVEGQKDEQDTSAQDAQEEAAWTGLVQFSEQKTQEDLTVSCY